MLWCDKYGKKAVLQVTNGNPGALKVTLELQHFTKWMEMLEWLYNNGHIADKLWVLYKDKFHCSILQMGEWIQREIYKDLARRKHGNKL